MSTLFKMLPLIISLSGYATACFASNDAPSRMFFDSVESRYRQEYVACTGDTRPIDMRRILLWKKAMDDWLRSEEGAGILRDYRKTIDSSGAVFPCKLMEWSKRRKTEQDVKESEVFKELLDSSEASDAVAECMARTASRFDFADIPFGVSRAAFSHVFKKKFNIPLLEKPPFLYVEELPVHGRTFLAAFYFNDSGKLYKYEIESVPQPADSLNQAVRPAARSLSEFFEQKLGPALYDYRIGFFDIKSGELAVLKKWETPADLLLIGLSVFDYHYYAKAVVTDKKLLGK